MRASGATGSPSAIRTAISFWRAAAVPSSRLVTFMQPSASTRSRPRTPRRRRKGVGIARENSVAHLRALSRWRAQGLQAIAAAVCACSMLIMQFARSSANAHLQWAGPLRDAPGHQRNQRVRRDFWIKPLKSGAPRDCERPIVPGRRSCRRCGIGVEVPGPERRSAMPRAADRTGSTVKSNSRELQPDVGNREEVSRDDFRIDLLAAIAFAKSSGRAPLPPRTCQLPLLERRKGFPGLNCPRDRR